MEFTGNTYFDKKMLEYTRKGMVDRLKWMKNIHRVIIPQYVKRIQSNDKTVLNELVLPNWVNWNLLYDWAMNRPHMDGHRLCILCGEPAELGVDFNEKYICEHCFIKLKNLRE